MTETTELQPLRVAGTLTVVAGLLLLLPFILTRDNPNVGLADSALLVMLLGALVLAADVLRRRVTVHGSESVLVWAGWSLLSAGLLIAFAGFLLGNQVMCFCPASGQCACQVPLYELMVYCGSVTAIVGAALTTVGAFNAGFNSMKALGASLWSWVVLLFSVTVAFIPLYLYGVNLGAVPAQNVSYTTNGLTCPIPSDYSALGSLVSAVTQDPRFVNLADGETYVFGNGEMITGRTVTTSGTYDNDTGKAVGGTTVYLPDAMELVFYGFGPTTHCSQVPGLNSPANQVIVVQVPLQSGEFNMTGATFFNSMFP